MSLLILFGGSGPDQPWDDILVGEDEDIALQPAVESYQQRNHDFHVWDAVLTDPEDDDLPHDGSTDPVHFPGVPVALPDQPWDEAAIADDDDALQQSTESYQQRDHDPLPGDGPWVLDEDDELPHDGSTDPVHFPGVPVALPDQPWDEILEVEDDPALEAQPSGYQQSNNVANDPPLPESFSAPFIWDDDSEDLEILDDYDNTGPDEAFEEQLALVDDDDLPHDGSTDPVHFPGTVTLLDQPWDEPLALVDDEPNAATGDDEYQSREHDIQPHDGEPHAPDDDELPHEGSTNPVHFARDEYPPQSFDAEFEGDDELPHDGSTDPIAEIAVVPPDQPWDEAPLDVEDDDLPHDGSTDAEQREHDIQPHDGVDTFVDDDEPPHDGSTDAIQDLPVVQPDQPWDGAPLDVEDDDLPHEGSTDALQREHDVQPWDGEDTFVDDDEPLHDGSTGPVPDQDRQEDIAQSFADDSVFDDLEAEALSHDGSTDPVSTDPGQPEPPVPPEHPGHGGGPDGPPRRPPRPGMRPDEEYLDDEIIYTVIALVMAGAI